MVEVTTAGSCTNYSQLVADVRSSSGNSNSYGNEISFHKEFLPEEDTFGRPEPTSNPLKGIHDLPLELILWILHAALYEVVNVPDRQGGDYLSALKILAAVCRTWKSAIQKTPSFWTVIESSITPDEMHYMLRKSGKRHLTFRHPRKPDSAPNAHSTKHLDTSSFLNIANPHMSRCSSLCLAMNWSPQVARIVGSPAPILRDATVVAAYHGIPEHVTLFDGQAGMLENLQFENIPLRWDLGLPPKLRRIRISYGDAPIHWVPHPRQIVSALSSCSGIEVANFTGTITLYGRLQWELGVEGHKPMAELPMLKELKIENMSIAGSAYILERLATPPLRNLRLVERLQPQADPVAPLLYPPNPVLIGTIRDALVRCEKFTLMLELRHCILEIEGVEGQVYLSLRCADPDEVTRWLAEKFVSQLSSVPELKLATSPRLAGPELRSLPRLLRALRNVVRLDCRHGRIAAGILVEHLIYPYQALDGCRWHWPGLRYLKLDDAYTWHAMALTMLRERYGAFQKEGKYHSDGRPKWYPCSLATLQLNGMKSRHPDTFREIARIVGEEVLENA